MDVTLLLTHRCNLACGYCYAGEHHHTDIEPSVLERAIGLLYADGAAHAQLGFFGGEPFLAFDAMQRATLLARAEAERKQRRLTLQVTTNGSVLRPAHVQFVREHGVAVTVSIDGIREAHDRNRPCAGGKPSFDQVHRGLRMLIDAGVECDAMMVITPETAEHAYLSTSFLWGEGVRRVRANLALGARWNESTRAELREQLVSIGWELLARRMKGEDCTFAPFEHAIRAGTAGDVAVPRAKVVVSTSGHLYPCAPMVGEDRDERAEAALRIGHLDQGVSHVLRAVAREGVRCERGGRCECAAYQETGERATSGPNGRWYASTCAQIGATVAEALASYEASRSTTRARRSTRRPLLIGLGAIVGAAAIGRPIALRVDAPPLLRSPCSLELRSTPGEMRPIPPPESLAPIEPTGPIVPDEPGEPIGSDESLESRQVDGEMVF